MNQSTSVVALVSLLMLSACRSHVVSEYNSESTSLKRVTSAKGSTSYAIGLSGEQSTLRIKRVTVREEAAAGFEHVDLDEKRAKEVLAKELKLTDPKIIDQSYANFKAETPPNAEIDRTGAENIVTTLVPPGANRNLDAYIDTSLTDGLRADGFIGMIEKKYGKK
jgi:hypothetical protein